MNGPLRPEALAGEVGCIERWPDESPCGTCSDCLTAMLSDPRYGSHSDHP
ncbi:hypothetical protein [Nonomuraea sp. WAC 01424]|nr:hypothetical protein [Nonomuraea sp. WAC 01424]